MTDQTIQMSDGIPVTVLPDIDPAMRTALEHARAADDPRAAVAELVSHNPRSLESWAALGDLTHDVIGRYAAYRVGYHRGLDALRACGWRGSGYVRWAHDGNVGFLHCLLGLHRMADAIGETDEAERTCHFLLQLDPSGVPDDEVVSIPPA
ncbi:MAG: DUF3151 family protein [Ilumatobacter sp.]|uniref:DUF3151 family protein n=1 Tax=Ilumatobacter sp. TaxID=1967498 RepID=UPI0026022B13|nr:DUF3151 family protein [Ilumatobacter sp.]MDJ0769915.1 DUF3151 family protein [Ilumatobacter sp.]